MKRGDVGKGRGRSRVKGRMSRRQEEGTLKVSWVSG
jgi:hypothetical protein